MGKRKEEVSDQSKENLILLHEYKDNNNFNARQQLITNNIKLVQYVVYKNFEGRHDQDDLTQIGIIGLMKAIDAFDFQGGNQSLSTYAYPCILNEILMYIRKDKKHDAEKSSLDANFDPKEDGSDLTYHDSISDLEQEKLLENVETRDYLRGLLINLRYVPKIQQELFCYTFGLLGFTKLSQIKVAKKYNISQSYVSRIIDKVIETLKHPEKSGKQKSYDYIPAAEKFLFPKYTEVKSLYNSKEYKQEFENIKNLKRFPQDKQELYCSVKDLCDVSISRDDFCAKNNYTKSNYYVAFYNMRKYLELLKTPDSQLDEKDAKTKHHLLKKEYPYIPNVFQYLEQFKILFDDGEKIIQTKKK